MAHVGCVEVQRRPVSVEEDGWIRDLVAASPEWRGVSIAPLFVIGECSCGCRSVALEQPALPQRPTLVGHQGLVADMSMTVQLDDSEDVVSVLLLHANGSLSALQVVWYNFPDPVPRTWTELSREIRLGD